MPYKDRERRLQYNREYSKERTKKGLTANRWAKSNPKQRANRVKANAKWRAKNVEKVRVQGRAFYCKHRAKRQAHSREKYHRRKKNEGRSFMDQNVARAKRWYKANPYYHYGMTMDDYDALLTKQGGRCAICRKPPNPQGYRKRLCVDHEHATGRIRGLLCNQCNAGIGQFRDDPEVLRQAAAWLESQQS